MLLEAGARESFRYSAVPFPAGRVAGRRAAGRSLGNPRFEEVDDLYWRPVQVQLEVLLPEPTQCTPLAIRDDNVDLNQVDIDAVDEGLAGLLSIRSSRREDGKKVEHRHKERNAPGCKRGTRRELGPTWH